MLLLETQQPTLKLLASHTNRNPVPSPPTIAPANSEPIQRAMPVKADDSVTTKPLTDVVGEVFTLLTRSEIEPILRKEKASSSSVSTELMSSYADEVIAKSSPFGYKVPKFQKFAGQKKDLKEHVQCFLDSMGPFAHDATLCLREFFKSLTDRAYN